jgi:hypothetical protein
MFSIDDWKVTMIGQKLGSAFSSLTDFACSIDDGPLGLSLKAVETSTGPAIEAKLVTKDQLPKETDAVCRVDWNWIAGSTIVGVSQDKQAVRLQLDPAGLLTISVQVWQGKPFLAFQPYKSPK